MAAARRTTPGARARRELPVDVLTAIALAALVLSLTAGLGVVGFFGLRSSCSASPGSGSNGCHGAEDPADPAAAGM